ncbi:MAG: 6-phosphogluconolactonase [Defluviimonas sp.]|uniref:6-phosphogluconolactonase n=1 Tax=Albidovulum sp. TaxID=1872424 RepID=UPI001DC44CF8|nr:6-phosphogluconolactonase [Paracoccaceae bacterium]MCC0063895.1 6-phosphogluconolactonase [Defluviimonas sp.]
MNLIEYPDAELLMFGLADRLASDLGTAIRQNGRASFAVPGGTTPGPVFDVMSGVGLDWEKVTVLPTDERWVPQGDPRSNAALIRARLLTGRAAPARFLSFHSEAATPEEATEALAAAVDALRPIDVVLLGMGADMHIASLFPGGSRLAEALAEDAPALVAMRAPGAVEPRVTLSAPVLAGAMAIHVLITGEAKRKALERARSLPQAEAPVRAVLDNATVHWAP